MLLRYIFAWIPMIFIGILNGILRESTYGKYLSELRAHQVSTLTGVLLFSVYIWGLTRFWSLESSQQAIAIGLIWLMLTIIFEFVFGHFIAGHSWQRLLDDYDFMAGRDSISGSLWIAFSPLLFFRL